MLVSSSSSNKYDVFLNFRGEDTRYNFTSHLYAALRQKHIETFIDNQLIGGDEISPSLLNAIKQSKIAVVIFSKGYASSRWCLEELVEILKGKNEYGLIVIPVFYGVDPSDVRKQAGDFGVGFSKLEERSIEKLQKWKNALREAANVSGLDSHVLRLESVLVEKIVKDISKRLNDVFPTELDKDLVGIESRIKEIESLLRYNSMDINTLGIWGIGGIGKTTIARAIVNKFSNHFDGFCFIRNVREESLKNGGLAQLRRELVSALLDDGNLNNCIPSLEVTGKRIRWKKVLIVFDDVTSSQQIKFLIENLMFGEGSLIIITTRDKQVLCNFRVKVKYEMKELENGNALKLFSRHAFDRDQPNVGYGDLSYAIMQYCQGVPLALEVLGRFLCGRSKEEWECSIKKFKKLPSKEIQKVLKISYDGLDDQEQNIFLDIAFLLKGEDRDFAIKFLDACGFDAIIGISVLEEKCLIKLSYNRIIMHDLLQEMGKEIVRQESVNDPGKRSRLWRPEDIGEVLEDNTGTEAIQGIVLDMSEMEEIDINLDTFRKMRKLRFLKLYGDNKIKIHDFGGTGHIFQKLRILHWKGYPLKSLPQNIRAENLVSLKLWESKIERLWNGVQNLVNLNEIEVIYCSHLTELPDLSKAQNLRTFGVSGSLNLKRCPEFSSCNLKMLVLRETAIEELPSSIKNQSRLVLLDLSLCSRLENIPSSLCNLESLGALSLLGCSNLQRLPDELGNLDALRTLYIAKTSIREVPLSILRLNKLETLSLGGLRGHYQNGFISTISSSFVRLDMLDISDCGITELPESLCQLSLLEHLILSHNNFERIPESIMNLSNLEILQLDYCQRLKTLPKLPYSLQEISARSCTSLESISSLSLISKLQNPLTLSRSCNATSYGFENCYKLEGDELRKVFEESLQKIPLTGDLGSYGLGPDNPLAGVNNYCLVPHIIFPGSEIPMWFKNQSMGSSITLELPPTDRQKLIIGFAFCLIFAFEEHHFSGKRICVDITFKVKTLDGNWPCILLRSWFCLGDVDSDHVILGYCFLESQIFDSVGTFRDIIEVVIHFHPKEYCFECLKKCGIRLLFAQDSVESKKNCSTSFISNDEEEEEDVFPKKKRRRG